MAGVKGRSGGARPGSGPKRRAPDAAWLAGSGPKRGPTGVVPKLAPTVPAGGPDAPTCPAGAPAEVAAVWRELAPHALAERTLEPRTAMAFLLLCQNVVLERRLAASPLGCAGPDHRGVMARVEVAMARFRLAPDGKPVIPVEPKDEWAEFDGLTVVNGGKA